MFLTDIWYAAGEIEARAVIRPSWAKVDGRLAASRRRPGAARLVVGRALIGLGRRIAAEPKAAG